MRGSNLKFGKIELIVMIPSHMNSIKFSNKVVRNAFTSRVVSGRGSRTG